MNPEVRLHLFVESEEMSVHEMSREIGCDCDVSHEKGSLRGSGRTGKVWGTSLWELRRRAVSATGSVFDLRDATVMAMQHLLARIEPHSEGFRRVARRATSVGVLLAIESPWTPALEFDPPLIAALGSLGLGLYIDVQLTGEDGSDDSADREGAKES